MKMAKFTWICGVFVFVLNCFCHAENEPVSVVDSLISDSLSGNGFSMASDISPDGRYVVFSSLAANLVPNDENKALDVFCRDRQLDVTTLISANPDGNSGNGPSGSASMSTNGQWIVFQSDATDLVDSDSNGTTDVFARNVLLGRTVLISVNTNGVSDNAASTSPMITSDGRFVAFESAATDLVTNYFDNAIRIINVYLRDLVLNTTSLVSVGTNGLPAAAGDSHLSGVSSDGRFVLFMSGATNLDSVKNAGEQIYLRDMLTERNYWISANVSNVTQHLDSSDKAACLNPVMSTDGQRVAFRVIQGPWSLVFYHDLDANNTVLISSNAFAASVYSWDYSGPSISDDGLVVAYMEPTAENQSGATTNQVYVWRENWKTNMLVSVGPDGSTAGNASSDSPVLSADGHMLAFLSAASNLTSDIFNESHARLYVRNLDSGTTKLLSMEKNTGKAQGDVFEFPIFSGNGERVVYGSTSDGLVNNDNNGEEDVFMCNIQTGVNELVSCKLSSMKSLTASDNSFISANGLSIDGRFAVFSTLADNLTTKDTNLSYDIYVRDMVSEKSLLVSANSDGTATSDGNSTQPSISGDGRLVAFQSDGANLVVNDTNNAMDVFIHDLETRETRLVSVKYGTTESASGISDSALITPDGHCVIFRSNAKDLTSDVFSDSNFKLYAYDTETGKNSLISSPNTTNTSSTLLAIAPNGRYAAFIEVGYYSGIVLYVTDLFTQKSEAITNGVGIIDTRAMFSGDGRWLAFLSTVTAQANRLIVRDLDAKTNLVVSVNRRAWTMTLDGDGSRIAYESFGTSSMPTNKHQIFVYDRNWGSNILVSANIGGTNAGNGDSRNPIISPDGRYVYFNSQATDLVQAADPNERTDVFMRDISSGTTRMLSVNKVKTASGNDQSSLKALSPDGKVVAIESMASDLVPMDFNMAKDVFLVRINEAMDDADNDNLPDSWEMQYFGSLERDGSGDFDGDGMSDEMEYLAGTDPTDRQSKLRATAVEAHATGKLVIWQATPGRTYQIQYKTNLNDKAWTDLEGTVTAAASSASKADDTVGAAEQRFYRVVLVH